MKEAAAPADQATRSWPPVSSLHMRDATAGLVESGLPGRGPRRRARHTGLLGCMVGGLLLVGHVDVRADDPPINTRVVPSPQGVVIEATTVIDAPAEQVAAVAGNPDSFLELLPAERVRITGTRGQALLVEVTMRNPWPIGVVRWTETVLRHRAPDGKTLMVEREAYDGQYYRYMHAVWRISPREGNRCDVSYQIRMDPHAWVPKWSLRRGMTNGMTTTVERLRQLSLRAR
jgi:polyketide cyclase/dehydrase/lipid transport protein